MKTRLTINIRKNKNSYKLETLSVIKIGKDEIEIKQLASKIMQRKKFIEEWTKPGVKGPYIVRQKCSIFNACIIPVVTYDAQVWAATKKLWNKNRKNAE